MINYNPKSWVKLIFAFHRSDTFRMLWKEIVYIGLFTLLVTFLELHYFPNAIVLEKLISVYSLIGFVISLLLVFRTNTAYDRWWEARKKVGELVNETRNIALKLSALLPESADRSFFKRMIPNFVLATKEHLREGVDLDELQLSEKEIELLRNKGHIPLAISEQLYTKLIVLKREGKFTEEEYLVLDKKL